MTIRPFASLALMTAATLALSACQKEADKPAIDNAAIRNVVENEAPAQAVNAAKNETESGNASSATPSGDAKDAMSGIPAAFRGRWGMVEADCDVSRSDTKGLVTVAPDSLKFYESMGRLKSIKAVSPTEVNATFAFSGEGQSWTKAMTLQLDDGGTTLVRIEQNPAGTFRHKRCA